MKKFLALLLAIFLCFSFTACSDNNEDEEIVVGNDWRVTGIVRDAGTIIREGVETDVLVCVDKEGAYFYYDSEDQELFDNVTYPFITKSGAWDAFNGISFDDLDSDGNSDVTIYLNDNGTEYVIDWIYTLDFGYILANNWEIPDDNLFELVGYEAFIGCWEYPDGKILEITDGDFWNLYKDFRFELLDSGTVQYQDDAAFLINGDGSSGGSRVYFDKNGYLVDGTNVLHYIELMGAE